MPSAEPAIKVIHSEPVPENRQNKLADLVKKVQQSRESEYEPYASQHGQFLPVEKPEPASYQKNRREVFSSQAAKDQEASQEEDVMPGAFLLQKKAELRKQDPFPEDFRAEPLKKKSKTRKKLRNWAIAFAVLLLGAFGALTYFSSADAIVVPKEQKVTVDAALVASPTTSSTSSPSAIPYQIMTINEQGSELVPAITEKQVSATATGTVTLFNAYATKPYRLVRNTRIQTPQGMVFKLSDSVTLPGMKTINGKTVPGSADVAIYAEAPGTDYNVGFSDFSLPGFKGEPQYTTIYGRSKTSVAGGFVGTKKIASDSDVASARAKIRASLQQKALHDAGANIPNSFVLPQNAYSVTYQSLPDQNADTGVTIGEQATLRGIIFPKEKLQDAVMSKAAPNDKASFSAPHLETLSFVSANPDFGGTQEISFSLKGDTTLVGIANLQQLGQDLTGQPLSNLPAILAKYPGIDRVEAGIRPPWMRSFPKNPASLSVTLKQ